MLQIGKFSLLVVLALLGCRVMKDSRVDDMSLGVQQGEVKFLLKFFSDLLKRTRFMNMTKVPCSADDYLRYELFLLGPEERKVTWVAETRMCCFIRRSIASASSSSTL